MAARKRCQTLNMRRKRHTPEEIIKKLREAATLLAGGQSVEEVCKKLEVSPPTYHRRQQRNCGDGPVILQTELWPSTLAARRPANSGG